MDTRSELSHLISGQVRRETAQLVRQALSEGRHAYVLVENRPDGNAPLPVQALSEMIRAQVMFSLSEPRFRILKTWG